MIRTVLSDAQWDRIEDLDPGKEPDRGVTGRDSRLFVEGALWVARTADTFRDYLDAAGIIAGIPSNRSRAQAIAHDPELYKERHLVECFINQIKHFRRITAH